MFDRIRSHPEIQKRPAVRQFVKFAIVGASNTIVDFSVFLFMRRVLHLHYLEANFLAFSVAAPWSYIFNRTWTFRDKNPRIHTQFVKFFLVAVVGLGLTSFFLYVFIGLLDLYDVVAKVLVIALVLFWNFLANRRWTFRPGSLASGR